MGLPPSEAGGAHESETPLEAAVVAARPVGAPGTVAGAMTVTDALPEMLPTVAMTLPLPVVGPAVKEVELPDVGETVPRPAGLTDQPAPATETALPYASAPVAGDGRAPPPGAAGGDSATRTRARGGRGARSGAGAPR